MLFAWIYRFCIHYLRLPRFREFAETALHQLYRVCECAEVLSQLLVGAWHTLRIGSRPREVEGEVDSPPMLPALLYDSLLICHCKDILLHCVKRYRILREGNNLILLYLAKYFH